MIPYRLCCGKQHLSVECPDGKVLCCICFERVEQSELNVLPDGKKENCCKRCVANEAMLAQSKHELEVEKACGKPAPHIAALYIHKKQ